MSCAARARPALDGFVPRPACGLRVGLLGGSFNPAHAGHLAVSLEALKRLSLDEVWWLVSPQNPLKDRADTAPFRARLAAAAPFAAHPRIHVSDLERRWGCAYTADTVDALARRCPDHAFVWLMGADAFAGLERWKHWTRIMERMPVCVLDRPGYTHAAIASKAAVRYMRFRVPEHRAAQILGLGPPAWTLLHVPLRPESSTVIRAQKSPIELYPAHTLD